VWAREHHLSKSAEGFAAKLAPWYEGAYQVVDFVSPVICKIRHAQSKKDRTVHVGELKQQQNEQTTETTTDKMYEAPRLCVRPKRESTTRHAKRSTIRIGHKDMDKNFTLIQTPSPQD